MKVTLTFISLLLLNLSSLAQVADGSATVALTLSEVALLDIEPNNSPITLALNAPTEAGSPVSSTTLATAKWVNYTSAVSTGDTRNVAVQISAGTLPSGVRLSLTASAFSGTGEGSLGISSGSVNISGAPQVILSGIGGAYTGNGTSNGHSLNYVLAVDNVTLLEEVGSTVTVTFTLIDN